MAGVAVFGNKAFAGDIDMPAGVRARCRTAAYNSGQVRLVRITGIDCARLRGGSEYAGSPGGPGGRPGKGGSGAAGVPGGGNLPVGPGWNALISGQAWSALACAGSGSAGFGAVPGGRCLSSGIPPYRNQGTAGCCRAGTEGFARQFPGSDHAARCPGCRVSPGI
jgi:hypothetical protein